MAKNTTTIKGETQSKSGLLKKSGKSNGIHNLNVPMDKSQMSKSDKTTMKAWEYTYKNRDKRVD